MSIPESRWTKEAKHSLSLLLYPSEDHLDPLPFSTLYQLSQLKPQPTVRGRDRFWYAPGPGDFSLLLPCSVILGKLTCPSSRFNLRDGIVL